MYWQVSIVDRWITQDHLRTAFADVFGLSPSRIESTDYPDLLAGPVPPEPRIHLERFEADGPFPLRLSIALVGDELERPVTDLAGTLVRARELVRQLGATMLFGTGPIAYSEQIRVAPDGSIDVVQLDWDDEDEDKFVIIGSRPFSELPAEAAHTTV
jgi:hypothetical protein